MAVTRRRLGVVATALALGTFIPSAIAQPTREPGVTPGSRVLLDAHNAYPEDGRWTDRIDRALATGAPLAIEQDLVWWRDPATGVARSIVSHGPPFSGHEPSLEEYFFRRVSPVIEQAVRDNRRGTWPVITLNLDFKTNEPEHHRAVWDLLARYERWLVTAERTASVERVTPLKLAPLLVLTGSDDTQERTFHDAVPLGQPLRVFGAVHSSTEGVPGNRTNYRRWVNYPWAAVEPEGQPKAGAWTPADAERLKRLVDQAHDRSLWIRFYTLNGHDPVAASRGWTPSYNFGSLEAAQERWSAARRAGVDFIAVDQYEAAADHMQTRVVRGRLTRADYERLFEQEFDVPPGTERIDVELIYRDTDKTVIDLGLRDPVAVRGWSGGGPQRIFVSTHSASYGYTPGPLTAGRWAVVLGVPNIREGVEAGYEIRIRLNAGSLAWPTLAHGRRWYAGDLHSHSGHSDGRVQGRSGIRARAPSSGVFDAARQHGLDFVALTDHNTASHWADVDRLQAAYPDVLLLHGREVTTYRGHVNAFGETRFRDFRLGPTRSMRTVLEDLRGAAAFVSINHPTSADDETCMGCGWNDTDAETMSRVDGVEIVHGGGSRDPLSGWNFWASMLNRGHRLIAVGGSDEHTPDETVDRRLGTPSTMVCADALAETSILSALWQGRVYVRLRGTNGARFDFYGTSSADGHVELTVETAEAAGHRLEWVRRGEVVNQEVIGSSGTATLRSRSNSDDWFAVRLFDRAGPIAFSNAIFHGQSVARCQ